MTRPGPQSWEVMETGSRPGVSPEQSRAHSPRLLPAASPPSGPLTLGDSILFSRLEEATEAGYRESPMSLVLGSRVGSGMLFRELAASVSWLPPCRVAAGPTATREPHSWAASLEA